ncbi:unnamed protein product, partial [Larinioides sclopetarius]
MANLASICNFNVIHLLKIIWRVVISTVAEFLFGPEVWTHVAFIDCILLFYQVQC